MNLKDFYLKDINQTIGMMLIIGSTKEERLI